jgi:hypothetical protein
MVVHASPSPPAAGTGAAVPLGAAAWCKQRQAAFCSADARQQIELLEDEAMRRLRIAAS